MCLKSVGLFQNALETAGFSTASLTTQTLISAGLGLPRVAHVRFPVGNSLGEPHDVAVQSAILKDLLTLVWDATAPDTFVKFDYRWRKRLGTRS
jgi:hypothetical protein